MKDTSLIFDIPTIDITTYAKSKGKEEIEFKCGLALDPIHDKVVAVVPLFNGLIDMPVCDRHLTWHKGIVTLYYDAKLDVDLLLSMTRDDIMRELMMRGLIPLKQ